MPLAAVPVFVWLVTSLATLLPGWVIVRFLPVWASIPLMVILAVVMSAVALFMIAMAVPGDSKKIKQVNAFYSAMLCLAMASPIAIAIKLYDWVG